jgi:microcystin-dependent protein
MAIDFPPSPTNGQTFTGSNGVIYTWDGTVWLATGSSVLGGGDFFARNSADLGVAAGSVIVKPNTVVTGNSGNWYVPATGRYTPPPGRYSITAHSTYISSSGASTGYLFLYKNGVNQIHGYGVSSNTGWHDEQTASGIFDANGADYFEIGAGGGVAGTIPALMLSFSAFPISGIKGPPGDPYPHTPTTGGDFCAHQSSSFPSVTTSFATLILTQVITGNSGGWYNTSNGRYTPPAGRYYIEAGWSAQSTVGASHHDIILRKNGVQIAYDRDTTATTNYGASPRVTVVVDCNGTDWFDIQAYSSAGAGHAFFGMTFLAYPTSGMKGPQGDPGVAGGGGDIPVGGIIDFAGSVAPAGWLLCNGQSVTVAAYGNLHTAIGYTFGGSGASFNVPDLGGRVTAGKETTVGGVRLTAAGAGIIGSTLGAVGGAQTHTLTEAQTTSHTHGLNTHDHTSYHGSGYPFIIANGGDALWTTLSYGVDYSTFYTWHTSGPYNVGTTTASGSGATHQNTQPTIIMNKIIKT